MDDMGLPSGEEDENGLKLMRCTMCDRVLFAGSCAAHEQHCRIEPPQQQRLSPSPAPSSTTASVPVSSNGRASISQVCP